MIRSAGLSPVFGRVVGGRTLVTVIVAGLLFAFGGGQPRAETPPTEAQPAPARGLSTACVISPRPNSLWSLAQCCAKDLKSNSGCRYYSRPAQFVILKDNSRKKPAAYLIIPTAKLPGIEDRQIFKPPFADFWAYGWQEAQTYVNKPAAETALAINSIVGRTQNQLHIHIACVRPDVAETLARNEAKIGADPATALQLPLGPGNHTYRVIKVMSLTAADSPYNLVAAMPGAGADMADQSIAVVGSTTPGSYYVLDTYAHGDNPGSAEELLDQYCAR
jgi:CDP-diacylglycerol pyrophosphatase